MHMSQLPLVEKCSASAEICTKMSASNYLIFVQDVGKGSSSNFPIIDIGLKINKS